jgi:hypothetical protein
LMAVLSLILLCLAAKENFRTIVVCSYNSGAFLKKNQIVPGSFQLLLHP